MPRSASALCSSSSSPAGDAVASGRVLAVGRGRSLRTLKEASKYARDGDTIEVDPEEFRADVAVWPQDDLTIRCRNGRATLVAGGAHAEGKGTFVTRGRRQVLEGLAFLGSRVPDRNGAGIRIERGEILVRNCHFEDNENGILAGNDGATVIDIRHSSFVDNGAGDGLSHNLYVGTIARLSIAGCYLARSRFGHLLKSRASETTVAYSRLSSESATTSYELEFPNGGRAVVFGSLIQQGEKSDNSAIISYGAESYRGSANSLTIAFSTLVNDRSHGGVFVVAKPGVGGVALLDNLLVGKGSFEVAGSFGKQEVREALASDFADPTRLDFRLRTSSRLVGTAGLRGTYRGELPCEEYKHPGNSIFLGPMSALTPLNPGAFQRLVSATG